MSTTPTAPAHTMERLIENGWFMAWCKKCPWQKSAPLADRETVDEAAAEHLEAGNMFGLKFRKKSNDNGGEPNMENINDTTDNDAEISTFDDPANSDDNSAPVASSETGDQVASNNQLIDSPHDVDGLNVGDSVYEPEVAVGAPAQREGVVIASHDDGTVTVGFYAAVERIPADAVKPGSAHDATDTEQ